VKYDAAAMAKKVASEPLVIAGREVAITNPTKVFFLRAGYTKLDLVRYYLAVQEGALAAIRNRPMALKRYPNGAESDFFFQKRAPDPRPPWIETVTLAFPSGRTAAEIVINDAAQLAWAINLGCIDLNPHPVRADDLDHPDELRVDLDPTPGVSWGQIREVALVTKEALEAVGLVGWPKTSGSKGMHVYARLERRWTFHEVRRAAVALARDIERRVPALATTKWWKEERHGVFIDYNQNAKDRTIASAYSVRPTPDARVSAPLTWPEVQDVEPGAFTLATMPERFARLGDVAAGMDAAPGSLEALLALADAHEREGLLDAPWPPHYEKMPGEPDRVQPSRRRSAAPKKKRATHPLLVISKAQKLDDAKAGLERWRARHPNAAALLEESDILVDSMRGRSATWWRIRVNLRHVPEADRPPQEPPDPDYDPWAGFRDPWPRRKRAKIDPGSEE
jgi:bifunctional non-homologous end joining protein LigD